MKFGKLLLFLLSACFQAVQASRDVNTVVLPQGFSLVPITPTCSYLNATTNFPPLTPCTSIYGFIMQSDSVIVVAIRGTSGVQDFIADSLYLTQSPYTFVADGGRIASGFYSIYTSSGGGLASLRDQIISTLQQLDPEKELYITGQSLGAALATLSAPDIAANTQFKDPQIVTFASPRVGDPQFACKFDQYVDCSIRVVNQYDSVPQAPPAKLGNKQDGLLLYEHVKGYYPIAINNDDILLNHEIYSAYFTELSQLFPNESTQLCTSNPGYCPSCVPNTLDCKSILDIAQEFSAFFPCPTGNPCTDSSAE